MTVCYKPSAESATASKTSAAPHVSSSGWSERRRADRIAPATSIANTTTGDATTGAMETPVDGYTSDASSNAVD